MTIFRIQVEHHYTTGLPEDVATNVFHVEGSSFDMGAVDDHIRNFWQGAGLGVHNVEQYLGPLVSRTDPVDVKVYDLDDPEPRSPIATHSWTCAGALSGDQLPAEVAVCASYHALPVAGIPPSRLRGRVYIGPLDAVASDAGGRVVTDLQETLAQAADNFMLNMGLAGLNWGVLSRAKGATIDKDGTPNPARAQSFHDIVGGFVDNEFDTQRRRGRKPTGRELWGV